MGVCTQLDHVMYLYFAPSYNYNSAMASEHCRRSKADYLKRQLTFQIWQY